MKIIVRDIAADGEFIYLLSTGDNAVYVVDAETEVVAAIIEEGSPRSGRLTALAGITVGHQGYLRIHDTQQNGRGEIYTYRREGHNFTWVTTQKYSHRGQIVPSPSGRIYEASVMDDTYKVTGDDGNFMCHSIPPRHASKHPFVHKLAGHKADLLYLLQIDSSDHKTSSTKPHYQSYL